MKKLFLLSSLSILCLFSSLIWSVETTGDPYEVGSSLGQWLSEPNNSNRNLYKIEGNRGSGYLMDIFWIDPITNQIGFTDDGWSRVPEESHHLVFRTQREASAFLEVRKGWEELGGFSGPRCQGSYSVFSWHNCVGTRSYPCEADTPGSYTGPFENGRPHGQGIRYYKAERSGVLGLPKRCDTSRDQTLGTYVGGWKDGKRHGQGTYTSDKSQYVGEWQDNFQSEGTQTFPDGKQYVGEFKDGYRYGQGTWTAPSGYKYVGEWKEGLVNGQGIQTWPNGSKYVGEFKDDYRYGQGTYTWSSGSKYIGEWKDHKRHGQGTRTWPDGREYIGEWREGESHGLGNFYRADGSMMGGRWAKGDFSDGYAGQSCSGDSALWSDCIGTLAMAGGWEYVGEYKKGKLQGQGMTTSPEGEKSLYVLSEAISPDEFFQRMTAPKAQAQQSGPKAQAQPCDDLCKFEKASSAQDLGMWVVYAEKCADNYLMEKSDSQAFIKVLEGIIKRGVSEGRISRQAVNQGVNNAETAISMTGIGYEQQPLCQRLTMLNSLFAQPKDRY